jgi:hypothetical protein
VSSRRADRSLFQPVPERDLVLKTFCAAVGMICAVRAGVAYPVITTLILLSIAAVGIALFCRRPADLPPTRHDRRVKVTDILD